MRKKTCEQCVFFDYNEIECLKTRGRVDPEQEACENFISLGSDHFFRNLVISLLALSLLSTQLPLWGLPITITGCLIIFAEYLVYRGWEA